MAGLLDIIPDDTAFSMELDSEAISGDAEAWHARLERFELDDDIEGVRGPVVAWANVYRVHLDSDGWYDDLDVESYTAELVGAAFLGRDEFEGHGLEAIVASAGVFRCALVYQVCTSPVLRSRARTCPNCGKSVARMIRQCSACVVGAFCRGISSTFCCSHSIHACATSATVNDVAA